MKTFNLKLVIEILKINGNMVIKKYRNNTKNMRNYEILFTSNMNINFISEPCIFSILFFNIR